MVNWNPEILNKFLAPGISEFTSAEIPDLAQSYPQASHWVSNHFLNNVLRGHFKDRWRQVVLAYIRRAQNAFLSYQEARQMTLDYLDGNQPDNPRINRYFSSVTAWENFSLQISMVIDLFRWLNEGTGAFEKNDGSKEQRLYEIANLIKHTASAVNSGQCPESGTIPMWLENDGIHSFETSVTFQEASEILADVCNLANDYQDPRSLREKWSIDSESDENTI
jgi:hypothetical protein